MTPTIVAIRSNGHNNRLFAFLGPNNSGGIEEIQVAPPAAPLQARGDVVAYGEKIRDALVTPLPANSPLATALRAIFAAPNNPPPALRFDLSPSSLAEAMPWEAICDDQSRTLGLDRRFKIARIVSSSEANVRVFALPLRFAAFLSAANVSAKTELHNLLNQYKNAVSAGARIEMDVYLGEVDVMEELAARKANEPELADVNCHAMPVTETALSQALEERPPHLVHFFCHGRLSDTMQGLELATILGWQKISANESPSAPQDILRIPVISLPRMIGLRQVWLIVLNCCEGAAATKTLVSMASNLVRENAPACLGMSEPIAGSEANVVTDAVYAELFSLLGPVFTPAAATAPLAMEFDSLAVRARVELENLHGPTPLKYGRWLVPLFYSTGLPLKVQRQDISPDDAFHRQLLIQEVARKLQSSREMPIQARDALLAALNDVPTGLRPNRDGIFDTASGLNAG